MIIGKSLTALGGGGLKPEIRVTARAGALLNLYFKDSSIILQSYQLGAEETQHTFVVSVSESAYVVEDVSGDGSIEVLVDAVTQYSVEIQYVLYLYNQGDECTDLTGGWVSQGLALESAYNYPDAPTLTKNTSSMMMSRSKNLAYRSGLIRPTNRIDFSDYKSINAVLDISGFNDASMSGGWVRESLGTYVNEGTRWYNFFKSYNGQMNITASYDISSLSGLYVPYFSLYHDGVVTFHKIWLE